MVMRVGRTVSDPNNVFLPILLLHPIIIVIHHMQLIERSMIIMMNQQYLPHSNSSGLKFLHSFVHFTYPSIGSFISVISKPVHPAQHHHHPPHPCSNTHSNQPSTRYGKCGI